MPPRKRGLSKACGGLTKSSMLCVIARLAPVSKIMGTVFRSETKNAHGSSRKVSFKCKDIYSLEVCLILDPLLNKCRLLKRSSKLKILY